MKFFILQVSDSLLEKMIHWCRFLLILSFALQYGGCMETKQLNITAGHVFILKCSKFYHGEVNWTLHQDWDQGIKIINHLLGFFPAQESHSGNYSCYYSEMDEPFEKLYSISVTKSQCPTMSLPRTLQMNKTDSLACDKDYMTTITKLDSVSIVGWTWMKDCSPLNRHGKIIRFSSVSNEDKGVYTCILNFTYNNTLYTAAMSQHATVNGISERVPQKPKVIKPLQETLAVKLGSKLVLHCKVFVGTGPCETPRVEPINPYWLWNNTFVEEFPQHFVTNSSCTTENNAEYRHVNLTIVEVRQEFLHKTFHCIVLTSFGNDNGTVILIQQSQRDLYCMVAVITAYALVVLGFLLLYQFKVDLVLAYRKLSPFLKQQNDGKLYDAYVSYLHGDDQSVSVATTFALNVLPEVLENRLGYKLFISGRDELPGAAVHDVISEKVGKSRRLIIVLPSQAFTKSLNNDGEVLNKIPLEDLSLNNNRITTESDLSESSRLNWGPYECWVGLYDALVKECLQVILVQVGQEVDDTFLPESLRYVKHTQGILRWKQHYTSEPSGRFWKKMRYRMPAVQKARTAVMV